ncbi:TPA: hypothetical protein ACH3X1_015969 [Trebouxia sp. C0004]
MRQQLKGFAAIMADNQQFTAGDELMLQRWQDRVAKMSPPTAEHPLTLHAVADFSQNS